MATRTLTNLLSEQEHDLLTRLRQFHNDFLKIVGNDEASSSNDIKEEVFHIHALQRMIMSQAAARAYPSKYRRLGERISL